MNVLVTGACGYIGSQLVDRLQNEPSVTNIIATDIRDEANFTLHEKVNYLKLDVRSSEVENVILEHDIDTVVHLATIVTPGKKSNREFEYSVDVEGTENVLQGCVNNNVKRIIATSSGAAYGYHEDNPEWISESDAIRGNQEFAYSLHKRLVEEMMAEYRENHPQLEQVIFRIGTILGENVNNQITDLFKKKYLLGISGSNSPFVFIWDQDVISCLVQGITGEKAGVYNVAGDGAVSIDEIGEILKKKVIRIPPSLLSAGLFILKRLRLTQYGEEQINFLRYRPVLSNTRLKNEFDFIPSYTSKEVFNRYITGKWD